MENTNLDFTGVVSWYDDLSGKGSIYSEELKKSFYLDKSSLLNYEMVNVVIPKKGDLVNFSIYENISSVRIDKALV